MEFFDVTEYIDAHINSDDAFKFRYIIQYCNANLRDRTSTNTNSSNETPTNPPPLAQPKVSQSFNPSFNIDRPSSFKQKTPRKSSYELDEADIGGHDKDSSLDIDVTPLENIDSGFTMLPMDSEPINEDEIDAIIAANQPVSKKKNNNFANVDAFGMVYLEDYIEEKEDIDAHKVDVLSFEREQLIATMSLSITQSSQHSKFP